jgi:D-arginine dehydrogenase
MKTYDIAIVGAGIAGATAAYWISRTEPRASVVILERESQPGYHTTGRSAALYIETYGNAMMRALTVATGPFLKAPPAGFAEHPILTPRGVVFVARADQAHLAQELFVEGHALTPTVRLLSTAEVLALCPIVRPEAAASAVLEPDAMDIDVHALHRGYLRGARAHGTELVTDADVTSIERVAGVWRIVTRAGEFRAMRIVNASGAWADEIARLAGVQPIGLEPKRRTAITFDPPAGSPVAQWPAVGAIDETWYFKPDAGRILASPADETPMPPCDVQPDEIDIATVVERIEQATTFSIQRLAAKWAGLRSFVADRTIVIGADPREPSFFWLAGQGGYGIQTSAAAGQACAGLLANGELPERLRAFGVTAQALSPARLHTF